MEIETIYSTPLNGRVYEITRRPGQTVKFVVTRAIDNNGEETISLDEIMEGRENQPSLRRGRAREACHYKPSSRKE